MESNMHISQNKTGVVILILDKVELRRKNITNRDKEIRSYSNAISQPWLPTGIP